MVKTKYLRRQHNHASLKVVCMFSCVTALLPLQKDVIDMCPPAMLKPCTQTHTYTHTHTELEENKGLSLSLTHPVKRVCVCVCVRCTEGVAEQNHRRPIKLLTNCVYTGRGLSLSLYLLYTHTLVLLFRELYGPQ